MSQTVNYSTFCCPCGFEVKKVGQETEKRLQTIIRLHCLKCEFHKKNPKHKLELNYNEIKAHKKDLFRTNETRESHNIFTESYKGK